VPRMPEKGEGCKGKGRFRQRKRQRLKEASRKFIRALCGGPLSLGRDIWENQLLEIVGVDKTESSSSSAQSMLWTRMISRV